MYSGDMDGGEQRPRQPPRRHQRVPDRRNIVVLVLVLHQHGLAEQVAQRHPQAPRDVGEDVQPADIPLAPLDLAQPVLSPAHQVSQHRLRQPTPPPVEGNTLPDAELITRTTHTHRLTVQCLRPGSC